MPNQEKKQMKNAIHDMWKARICGDEKFASLMRVALSDLNSDRIGGYPVLKNLRLLGDKQIPP